MKLEQREWSMAALGFEEFSAPPCWELALPPLLGGHILESELETEVEFMSGGSGQHQPPGARQRGGGSLRPAAVVPRGTQSQEVPGAGSALQGDRAGEQVGPEQAPSDIEDNTETPAGAEVPHEGAGLLRGRLLGQAVHHLTGGRGQPEHRCPQPRQC
uniref:Uncharacterized protein n=1 Tax=Myotis myotis TaxID=51298 RepID=A0A7J8AM67_MYOMY|nr:hypothetical protein mMyoMyo1_007854 [Myotis myotis]